MHRRQLERTNHGRYFSECACGWSGGVYTDRPTAAEAHAAHIDGREPVGKLQPTLQIGAPIRGQ